MIVVSDTSPVTALLTVGQANLLVELFQEVVIPPAVHDELTRCHPSLPAWLRVIAVRNNSAVAGFRKIVDAGEAEAIVLAQELHADRLLMDERKGRQLARREGLVPTGLLGVVLLAKERRLIPSARALLQRLDREAGVYLRDSVRESALETVGE